MEDIKDFKLRLKRSSDFNKLDFDKRERPDGLEDKGIHFMFNLILALSGVRVHGDRSGCYYMQNRSWLLKHGDRSAFLKDVKRAYYNEVEFKYDWLTEFKPLSNYLSNPCIREARFIDLSYDEIRRKGYRIGSRRLGVGDFRRFKQQQVEYFLSHVSLSFPSGCMIVNAKPQDIVIRFDRRHNMIRLEGPGCRGGWVHFVKNR